VFPFLPLVAALLAAPPVATAPAPVAAPVAAPAADAGAATPAATPPTAPANAGLFPSVDGGPPDEEMRADDADAPTSDEDGEDTPDGPGESEAEERAPDGAQPGLGYLYTSDLSDAELMRLWKESPEALGSVSVGFADSGRIINGVQVPPDADWTVVDPEAAWGVKEVVDDVATVIHEVRRQHPNAPALRVNHIGRKEGGYLRPHQSHQSGRDVDLAFYYRFEVPPGARGRREDMMDPALNWALIKALCIHTDVQVVLVDRRIQKVLYEHALDAGEDQAWLDSLFKAGPKSLVKHARRHRDHFHVRFYAPRAQELGRRVQPLLAQRPDQNIAFHRVRRGDTLGHLAMRYGSSVTAIRKANHMRNNFLSLGRVLQIPLRGACTRCPLPPPTVLPPRRLPPGMQPAAAAPVVPALPPRPVAGAADAGTVAATGADGGVGDAAVTPGQTATPLPPTLPSGPAPTPK
jgi:murein endopeptidase/LysM repeat protein